MKPASYYLCAGSAAALGLGFGAPAWATTNGVSVQSVGALALGNVIADTNGTTIFFVDETTGNVSVTSGDGVRTATGGARALVTLACDSASDCSSKNVKVRVGSINQTSGRGQTLSNFDMQINSGALVGSGPARGDPIDFTLQPIGKNSTAAFYIGANVPISGDNTSTSGSASAAYYVYVAFAPSTPTSGSTGGLASATVTRGLGLSFTGSLNFGTLIRPSSPGTAVVDPDQGDYHNVNIIATNHPPPSRVVFTATGEPSKAISISIPHDFNMVRTGGGATLNVTVSSNAGSSGTLNTSGSYTFGVGGSINLSSSTLSGVYSGTFVVTVQYN